MTTQFISRVARNFEANADVPQALEYGGQGYDRPDIFKKALPGFAPFTTTSKRVPIINKAALETPAPGSYHVAESHAIKEKSSSSAFKSKSSRFEPAPSQAPNPSNPNPLSYHVKSEFDSLSMKYSKRNQKANIVHGNNNVLDMIKATFSQPAVPSIPTRDQSYGYEEDRAVGKLVPQFPIQIGFSGIKEDTVGPLEYNPKLDLVAKYHRPTKTIFSKDNSDFMKNMLKEAQSKPGPGAYNTFSSFDLLDKSNEFNKDEDFVSRLNSARRHQSSIFESKVQRDPMKSTNDTPGPGKYNIPSTIQVREAPPPEKQCFSTTGPRFREQWSLSTGALDTFAPVISEFDKLKMNVLRKKRLVSRSSWAQTVAFATTEPRHIDTVFDKDNIPGPNAYNPKVNLADHLPKPNKKSGPFGSTEERFKEYAPSETKPNTANEVLTARSFEREYNGSSAPSSAVPRQRVQTRPRFTSAFANTSRRFRTSADEPLGPPPTAYDSQKVWSETLKRGYKMKGPAQVDIRKRDTDQQPGPGHYKIPSSIGTGKSHNRKNVFLTTAGREEKIAKEDVPGPGTYNIQGSMIRPSHNILLSESY